MKTSKLLVLLGVALATLLAGNAFAAISGAPCVECHTMHNSQNGQVVRVDGVEAGAPALLLSDKCSGCHADPLTENSPTEGIPQIDGNDYNVNTLAGGSFYWVTLAGGDAKGHNVNELVTADGTLGFQPPGWDPDQLNAPNSDATWQQQLTCGGVYGCHGTHGAGQNSFAAVKGAHHEAAGDLDGSTVGSSYRFLSGIVGSEAADWELNPTQDSHNVYKGVARNNGSNDDDTTISHLCSQCHGKFHQADEINANAGTSMSNPWLRHPTDIDMRAPSLANTEYADYVYNFEAPAALSTIVDAASADYTSEAIVTCVSCHRAHGSPHDDLLRWDYALMKAGTTDAGAGTGCFRCHTTKDGI